MDNFKSKTVEKVQSEVDSLKENNPPCDDLQYFKFCSDKFRLAPCCNAVYLNRAKDIANWTARLDELKPLESVGTKDENMYFRMQGISMEPIFMPGDVIVVKSSPIYRIRTGDIIVYSTHGVLVCHRVVRKYRTEDEIAILTKGDNSLSYDRLIQTNQILGKVIGMVGINERNRLLKQRYEILSPDYFNKFGYLKYFQFRQVKKTMKRILIWLEGFKFYRLIIKHIWQGRVSYLVSIPIDMHIASESNSYIRLSRPIPYFKELSSERYSLQGKKGFYVVGNFRDTKIASLASILRPERCPYNGWWIHRIYVRVLFRGAGIASQLLKIAFEVVRKENAPKVQLCVLENNHPALELYRKFGFRPNYTFDFDGLYKGILKKRNLSVIIMEKEL